MSMSDAIEMVQFKLNPGVSESDFLAADQPISAWVGKQPGFRYRSLSRQDDGTWSDIVYWDSMENAKAAGEVFMKDQGQSSFMAMIDHGSVQMNHSQVLSCVMGTCSDA
jgi:hypothetical protein